MGTDSDVARRAEGGNVDPEEIRRFDQVGDAWWDPGGPQAGLHDINPLRLDYLRRQLAGDESLDQEDLVAAALQGVQTLDVGCGGGLLSEAMAEAGAQVLGIDMSATALEAARKHAEQTGSGASYRQASSGELLDEGKEAQWQLVTCMEVLEHVPQPQELVQDCARLAAPGATLVFSTINRTPVAFALAIVAAEYLLGLIPRGTHSYRQLIRPEELAEWCRAAGLQVAEIRGMRYNPLTSAARLHEDCSINYFLSARKPE